jgi:hypothetical protein
MICPGNVTNPPQVCINCFRYYPLSRGERNQRIKQVEESTMRIFSFSIAAIAVALVTGASSASPATTDVSTSTYSQHTVDADGRKVRVDRHRPPALRVEVRTRRPSRRYVWIDGHWRYRHASHVWVKGRWTPHPRHGPAYVRPLWVRHGGGWVQVGGFRRF